MSVDIFSIEERKALALAAICQVGRSSVGPVATDACIALAASDGERGVSRPRELVAVWVRRRDGLDRFAGVQLRTAEAAR